MLIKKHKPKYNTISKDDKSYFVLVITDENFPRVVLVRNKDIDKDPFKTVWKFLSRLWV